jgi:hypothetical protein
MTFIPRSRDIPPSHPQPHSWKTIGGTHVPSPPRNSGPMGHSPLSGIKDHRGRSVFGTAATATKSMTPPPSRKAIQARVNGGHGRLSPGQISAIVAMRNKGGTAPHAPQIQFPNSSTFMINAGSSAGGSMAFKSTGGTNAPDMGEENSQPIPPIWSSPDSSNL